MPTITITIPPDLYKKYKSKNLETEIIRALEKGLKHRTTWKPDLENKSFNDQYDDLQRRNKIQGDNS